MFRQIVVGSVLALVVFCANAAGFTGVFERLDSGMVTVSGKSYPLKPDVMAEYDGRLVAMDQLPVGTDIEFELGQFDGVSSVVRVAVTQVSDELDAQFPPH